MLARDVARAASAWLNAPVNYEAYRRLVAATGEWNAYNEPHLDDASADHEELLDELAEQSPPKVLGEGMEELGERIRPQRPGGSAVVDGA